MITQYSFTFVLLNSLKYHANYVRDITFDNHCITQYFRHVDARRYRSGKRTLLPLKKYEEQTLSQPFQLFVSAYQSPVIKLNLVINALFLVFLCVTCVVDTVVIDVMRVLIANTAMQFQVNANDSGEEKVEIKGDGMLADLAKKLASAVNGKKMQDKDVDNSHCLPRVSETQSAQMRELYQQCVLLGIASLVEIYVRRFNRNICALFYRKLEKTRVLWLYNDTLKKRLGFIKNAKKKVAFKKRNGFVRSEGSFSRLVFERFKNYALLIKVFTLVGVVQKRYCVLCNHSQRRTSLECSSCLTVYCIECWLELDEKCVCCSIDFQEEHSWEYEFEE
jgi:hypothetical protein